MQIDFLKNCAKGFIASVLASALLIFIFGYVCYTREDPGSLISIFGIISLYVSAFTGGFVASRFNKSMGLLSGLATGGAFMLAVVILSLILRSGEGSVGLVTWIMFLLIALVGAVGGYAGVPSSKRRKKHARKRK